MFDADIYHEMQRIRIALETLPDRLVKAIAENLLERDEEPTPQGCQHPTEKRADLGGGEWECTACQFKHVPAEPEVAAV